MADGKDYQIRELLDEIERVRAECAELNALTADLKAAVEEWRERWQAERADHERTQKYFDKMWDQGP